MLAKQEIWNYADSGRVWVGKYRNSHNLPHWHHDCELAFVESGSIDIFCEKESYSLTAGQALFVDSGQVHYMQAHEEDTILAIVIFNADIIKDVVKDTQLACPLLNESYPVEETYEAIRRILSERKPYFRIESECELLKLFIEIFRSETLAPRRKIDRTAESLRELLADIGEKFSTYTFSDAVEFMGMSEAYLSRYFRAATGVPFSRYLNDVKTKNAIRLIKTRPELTMTEVASACGFDTIRTFNRVFKECTGYAPSRLPEDYVYAEEVASSQKTFNPTLVDCQLIESPDASSTPFTVVYRGA